MLASNSFFNSTIEISNKKIETCPCRRYSVYLQYLSLISTCLKLCKKLFFQKFKLIKVIIFLDSLSIRTKRTHDFPDILTHCFLFFYLKEKVIFSRPVFIYKSEIKHKLLSNNFNLISITLYDER